MMYGYYQGFDGGHSFLGGLFMIFLFVLIIVFLVRLFRGHNEWSHHYPHDFRDNRALDILKERYAKGEIDKAEFEIRKKDLIG